jgi:hypothetical protein
MGYEIKRPYLSLRRRRMWWRRRKIILALLLLGMIPPNAAAVFLASYLIPNPHRLSGDQVWRHTPLRHTILAYEQANPVGFTEYFVLPTYDEVLHLARALRLSYIRGRHGHIAAPGEALLVVLLRLRCKQNWRQLSDHWIFRTTPGHRWSQTKMNEIVWATMLELHNLHGARMSWSRQ